MQSLADALKETLTTAKATRLFTPSYEVESSATRRSPERAVDLAGETPDGALLGDTVDVWLYSIYTRSAEKADRWHLFAALAYDEWYSTELTTAHALRDRFCKEHDARITTWLSRWQSGALEVTLPSEATLEIKTIGVEILSVSFSVSATRRLTSATQSPCPNAGCKPPIRR